MLEKIISGKFIAGVALKACFVAYGMYVGIRNYDTFEYFKTKAENKYAGSDVIYNH